MYISEKRRGILSPKAFALAKVSLLLLISATLVAQQDAGTGLPALVRGDERFGTNLLLQVHPTNPARNVVVSPLSLTLTFAALQTGMGYGPACEEIGTVFGWGKNPRLSVPARMLLAAFEKPQPFKRPTGKAALKSPFMSPPEGTWITNTVLYRAIPGKEPIPSWFMTMASKYYGMEFKSTGTAKPTTADLKNSGGAAAQLAPTARTNDVLIYSGTHLQTAWRGNTFSMSTPRPGTFRTEEGETKQVQVLNSEMESYLYAKTETFEAVVLPANTGYMLAVLPAPGRTIQDLERQLGNDPDFVDKTLQKHLGTVAMPLFHFQYDSNLRTSIESLGIKTVFNDLGRIIDIPKSHLTEIKQSVDIQVDKNGILANADTVMGAIYGGIMGAQDMFHMSLDRPFLFLIRDQNTNALLFIGAVMDPTQN